MNLFIKVGSMQYKEKFCDEEIMRSHSVPLRAVLTCLGPWSSQANGAPMGVDGRLFGDVYRHSLKLICCVI